jgi:signal transduction histidine kinase
VSLTARKVEGDLRIEVTDTGVGFSDDERAHAFERFYRGREARSMRSEGSGLGLSIAQRIAELHHGRLAIEPRAAGGTTMRIVLPLIG